MVLQGLPRLLVGWLVELAMAGMNLFMLIWGVRLVHTTWFQVIADFPLISVGISYLPVPIGGAITLLFVVERLWTGRLFQEPVETDWRRELDRCRSDLRMDLVILIGGFAVLCALGMPVAYALGLAAVLAALGIDIPLEAVMLKVWNGTDDFALLAIPFFILAGGIMAEGGPPSAWRTSRRSSSASSAAAFAVNPGLRLFLAASPAPRSRIPPRSAR